MRRDRGKLEKQKKQVTTSNRPSGPIVLSGAASQEHSNGCPRSLSPVFFAVEPVKRVRPSKRHNSERRLARAGASKIAVEPCRRNRGPAERHQEAPARVYRIMSSRLIKLARKPIRVCHTLHHCELCNQPIKAGEQYHDGGYGMRAHEVCVRKMLEQTGDSEAE